MSLAREVKRLALRAVYNYLDKDPQANLPRLMEWVDSRAGGLLEPQREVFRKIIEERDSNWYRLMESLWSDVDGEVRKTLFENLIINANLLAALQARETGVQYGCAVPWMLVLNLSGDGQSGGMPFDALDDIIEEAKSTGTYAFVLCGDRELLRRDERIALCNKHQDCQFMDFISGNHVDAAFADQLLRVKNCIPALQLRGTEEDRALEPVMELLRQRKLAFGAFCFYDEENQTGFAREEVFEWMVEQGNKFCFFFSSLPEDRDYLYGMTRLYRQTKPLLTVNFCKDKAITGGCLAARYYCAVDQSGRAKPCPFIETEGIDVQDKSLLAAYRSPLFRDYFEDCPPCRGRKG